MKFALDNLPSGIPEAEFLYLCKEFGEGADAALVNGGYLNRSEGFALVQMDSRSSGPTRDGTIKQHGLPKQAIDLS